MGFENEHQISSVFHIKIRKNYVEYHRFMVLVTVLKLLRLIQEALINQYSKS